MSRPLKWTDSEEIGMALHAKMPDVDPLEVRFTDLRRWVMELPDFDDNPETSSEKCLEAIQMAGLDHYPNAS